jgi:hypothetical protein
MPTRNTTTGQNSRNTNAELAFLTRALKAPSLAAAVERLAERARTEGWTHEEFLAACLRREVAARETHGGEGRIRAARFPARKSLEDFDVENQRSLRREVLAHLGTLRLLTAAVPAPGGVTTSHRALFPDAARAPRCWAWSGVSAARWPACTGTKCPRHRRRGART